MQNSVDGRLPARLILYAVKSCNIQPIRGFLPDLCWDAVNFSIYMQSSASCWAEGIDRSVMFFLAGCVVQSMPATCFSDVAYHLRYTFDAQLIRWTARYKIPDAVHREWPMCIIWSAELATP
jgi:hypothetical protein